MGEYSADAPEEIKALFNTEGDELAKAGFREPSFVEKPDEYTSSMLWAYDAAAIAGRDVEDELEG